MKWNGRREIPYRPAHLHKVRVDTFEATKGRAVVPGGTTSCDALGDEALKELQEIITSKIHYYGEETVPLLHELQHLDREGRDFSNTVVKYLERAFKAGEAAMNERIAKDAESYKSAVNTPSVVAKHIRDIDLPVCGCGHPRCRRTA